MKTFDNAILRLQADILSFDNPIDIIHNDIPRYWRGNDLLIELGILSGDDVIDVSNFSSITLEVRELNNDSEAPSANVGALLSGQCVDLDTTVTLDEWKDGSKQHAQFLFSSTDSNLLPWTYWLSIWASTNDESAKTLTIGAGIIRVLEDGGGVSSTPPEPVEKYYTASDIDEKFVPLSSIDTSTELGFSDEKIPSQSAVKQYVDSTSGSGEANTASNSGTGVGVFKEKNDTDLVFKSLLAGSNVSIVSFDEEIIISSQGGSGGSGGHTIQHDGVSFSSRDNLNFVGILQVTDSDSATNVSIDTSGLLESSNNLSDLASTEEACNNLGALQNTVMINNKLLSENPVLSADDISEGETNKYNVQSD